MKLSTKERRFWVLFSEYERLIDSEAFALKEHNFGYVHEILQKKESVLRALNLLEQEMDYAREDDDDFQVRLDRLKVHQEKNARALKEMIAEVEGQLRSNRIAQKRVRGLQKGYGTGTLRHKGSGQSFQA